MAEIDFTKYQWYVVENSLEAIRQMFIDLRQPFQQMALVNFQHMGRGVVIGRFRSGEAPQIVYSPVDEVKEIFNGTGHDAELSRIEALAARYNPLYEYVVLLIHEDSSNAISGLIVNEAAVPGSQIVH